MTSNIRVFMVPALCAGSGRGLSKTCKKPVKNFTACGAVIS
jgi:hypothetical protein